MDLDGELCRRILVSSSGIIYWGGVLIQARRVRKKIGRTPNLKPQNARERLLWLGWTIVVLGWIAQPVWAKSADLVLTSPIAWGTGLTLIVGGYLATLWCYAAMGAAWRIGIDQGGTTELVKSGPYRSIRHPIYAFQMMMLIGATLLLPTFFSLFILLLHFICASIKAGEEEQHLLRVFGESYRQHMERTWRFLPKP